VPGIEVARQTPRPDGSSRVAQELGGQVGQHRCSTTPTSAPPWAATSLRRMYSQLIRPVRANAGLRAIPDTPAGPPWTRRSGSAKAAASERASRSALQRTEYETTAVGPVVSQAQFEKIQRLIETAISEGRDARHRRAGQAGGPRGPATTSSRPSSAGVTNDMTIARARDLRPGHDARWPTRTRTTPSPHSPTDTDLRPGRLRVHRGDPGRRAARGGVRAPDAHRQWSTSNGAPLNAGRAVRRLTKQVRQPGAKFRGGTALREFLEAKSIYGDNA